MCCNWLKNLFAKTQESLGLRIKIKPKPPISKEVKVQPINTTSPIQYLLNDPATPNLMKVVSQVPKNTIPGCRVEGYVGGGHNIGTSQGRSANVFLTISNSLNLLKLHSPKPLGRWASTANLPVLPNVVSSELNAFYDRASIQFYACNGIYTSSSVDIVAHELGHAILDAYRPDLWSATSLEVFAFHEAFGDFNAMMAVMYYDEMLQFIITQTNGNLKKDNSLSRLAEQLGSAIYGKSALRNALNSYKYTEPSRLPNDGPENVLSSEPHSFSRIFTGALYDILIEIYMHQVNKGIPQLNALQIARNVLYRIVLKAIQNCPNTVKFYEAMGKTMVWASQSEFSGIYQSIVVNSLRNRNIISKTVKMQSSLNAKSGLRGVYWIQTQSKTKNVKICPLIQSTDFPSGIEAEAPFDDATFFNKEGQFIDEILTSEHEAETYAHDAIMYLYFAHQIGKNKLFDIEENKLKRNMFI